MTQLSDKLLGRGQALLRAQIRSAVRRHYFPEVWYVVENWFQLLRDNRAMAVGYGIGRVAEAMAKSKWQLTCVDAATEPLDKLRKLFGRSQLSATFRQSELTALPGEDGSFDAIIAVNSLEYSPSPLTTLREIGRLLAPDGRALVSVFNRHSLWGTNLVISTATMPPGHTPPLALTKQEFIDLLKQSALPVAKITERACYLPIGHGPRLRIPIAGAFVALIGRVPEAKKLTKLPHLS